MLYLDDSTGVHRAQLYWNQTSDQTVLQNGSGAYISVAGSAVTVSGTFSASGAKIGCYDAALINATGAGNSYAGFMNASGNAYKGYAGWLASTDTISLAKDGGGGSLQLDGVANFTYSGSGNAFKPGGGAWAAISDARVKSVLDDYGSGLSDILRLRPVVYRYMGNDGDEHKHVAESRKTFIGLVAQEAELVMPELVTMSAGEIDGKKVDDLRTLDSTALIYALINSVKELKAEIEELKKR